MGGATGLRYEAVFPLLDRRTKDAEEWEQLFEDVQVLEHSALRKMREDSGS